jgi:hypothetical protein
MTGFRKLSPRKNLVLNHLLSGFTVVQASKETGVSERTVRRWVTEPVFKAELDRRQSEIVQACSLRLVSLTNQALDTLESVLNDVKASAGNRRLSAVAILEMVLKWRDTVDFEERITRLEKAVLNGKK